MLLLVEDISSSGWENARFRARLHKAIQCFHGKPFRDVGAVLHGELERQLPALERWDEDYLRSNGQKIELSTRLR